MQKKTVKKIYVLASVQIQCVQTHILVILMAIVRTQTKSEKEEND